MADWMRKLEEQRDAEEEHILGMYNTYIRLSDTEKEELGKQWDVYFTEVREKSPYYALFGRTKKFLSMGENELILARIKMYEYLERLKKEYTKIRRPSGENPEFLLVKYGEITHRKNIQKKIDEKKEYGGKKNETLRNVQSVFGS